MESLNRYYEILGVTPDSSLEEIKQAYRDLAKVWHPDRFPNESRLKKKAEEKMKEINKAYQELLDYLNDPYKHQEFFKSDSEQFSQSQESFKSESGKSTKSDKKEYYSSQPPPKPPKEPPPQQKKAHYTHNESHPMFKIIGFVIGGLIVFMLKGLFVSPKSGIGEQQLIETVNEINKSLPMVVDKEIRLDTVTADPGKKITCVYTLMNYSSIEPIPEFILPDFKKKACANEDVKYFLSRNVHVSFRYQGNDGGLICEVDVAPSDCNAGTDPIPMPIEQPPKEEIPKKSIPSSESFETSDKHSINKPADVISDDEIKQANNLVDNKDWQGLFSLSQQSIRLHPNDGHSWNYLGLAYDGLQQYVQAIQAYNEALRIEPNNPILYNNRGFAYLRNNQFDMAIADFNKAIAKKPSLSIAYLGRGYSYYKKSDYRRSLSDFQKACKMGDKSTCESLKDIKQKKESALLSEKTESENSIANKRKEINTDSSSPTVFSKWIDDKGNIHFSGTIGGKN
jgi:hypothetical protein